MYSAFKQFGIHFCCRRGIENGSKLQGFNVAGVVIGFLICIPYTFLEGLVSTSLFDKLPKAETYLSMLLKGVELGNILILLAIVVVAIVIVRAALQDDRKVCTFTLKRRIMHLHVLSKHFDTTLEAIYRRYMYIQSPTLCLRSTRSTITKRQCRFEFHFISTWCLKEFCKKYYQSFFSGQTICFWNSTYCCCRFGKCIQSMSSPHSNTSTVH